MTTANQTEAMDQNRRRELGQFFTPDSVADLMASFFQAEWNEVRLLDAGAGRGALTSALVRRLCGQQRRPGRIDLTAYEIDGTLIPSLYETVEKCRRDCCASGIEFTWTIRNEDFVVSGSRHGELFGGDRKAFNAAIVNPPYRKIRSDSPDRAVLSSAGIETSNLYTAFLALIVKVLEPGGELVAITPRSFCNGVYFRPFREQLLNSVALARLHVFESRRAAFDADDVLQENVIIHAIKGRSQDNRVTVSVSSGSPGSSISAREVAFSEVVTPNDAERFIHFPVGDALIRARDLIEELPCSLSQLGLSVSTGRVVDFRAREFLRKAPALDTVPLIYPAHFDQGFVRWPRTDIRKPNAIANTPETRDLLVQSGTYVLTKRFTAKEETRRLVACIYDPQRVPASLVGFENHLNYFHTNRHGMNNELAKGLAAFLNSTVLDLYFRSFSGHTQVNATDLRNLPYPCKATLERIAQRLATVGSNQSEIDEVVEAELANDHVESRNLVELGDAVFSESLNER